MRPFSIRDPLPTGTTLLEASAGTGKTWTVGALVTRHVAEGVATLDEMLIITFGRAASRELRERVREQLVEAERELGDPAAAARHHNELIVLLAEGDADVVARRRERLRAALADFDGATIATTHQFCQIVLRSLGTAGDVDANAELVESLDDVVVQIVDDLYLERFRLDDDPPFSVSTALSIARRAVGDPQARLVPEDADPGSTAARRVDFALAVRAELDLRKRALGLLGYDDLLSRLASALEGEDPPARDQMRRRWKVVLVDEFQDTDPVQWQVLERAFGAEATLILIGDPKQAIYAFRGGDVVTYLDAAQTAHDQATLTVNWRSDEPLVRSLLVPFEGAALGDPGIVVRHVDADHRGSRLAGGSADPFRLRVLTRHDCGVEPGKTVGIDLLRDRIAHDLADDITASLAGGTTFDGEPLQAGDIAVLVYSGAQAAQIQTVLGEHGIASVLTGGTNVFRSPSGDAWLSLLEAMERPQSSPRVRAAALTDFFGHTPADLAALGDTLTDTVATRIRDLSDLLRDRGIAAVFEATSGHGELARRVLERADGRRRMTDLRHVAQALHEASERDRLGPASMLAWLRGQRDEAAAVADERTRRLDSDVAAVQIVTIHRSKGLQYPIVYLPYLFDRWVPTEDVVRFHAGGERVVDIGGKLGSPTFRDSEKAAKLEDSGEQLRLLYVAATRAQSQVVAWWGASWNAGNSALTRLLFGRGPGEAVVPDKVALPSDEDVVRILGQWQALGGPVLEPVRPRERVSVPAEHPAGDLSIRTFDREVDATWRRTSYTGLTRADHAAATVGSEAPDIGTDDETDVEVVPADASTGVLSPMASLPTGADFGSLVHGVLERLDVTAGDLRAELATLAAAEVGYWGVDVDTDELADALVAVCRTPLGPLADDLTLETLLASRQLRELDFELPLAGGDTPHARAATDDVPRLGDLAPLLEQHLRVDDPMRAFADRLRTPGLAGQELRGYLSGSIDLGLRLPDGRVLVVDYKTNWLGDVTEPLSLDGYSPGGLVAAMTSGTYPLQSLLYSVVIHRFLRWRQPGYDPERHLGGILYLYVRGMAGPDTPRADGQTYGVFAWHPPASLVEALSDLLDGVVA